MHMRYRYRIEPTPAQQTMLARVFGCARVVFNDALRVRDEAYWAGIKLPDSEIQRRVITQAKMTTERAWLGGVPSVALVQSVNDSGQWTCPECQITHDRDYNAAKVILAAGRAERLNACGAPVSPPTNQGARGDETGSTATAA